MKKIINITIIFLLILIIFSNFYEVLGIAGLYSGQDPGSNGKDEAKKIINMVIGAVQVVGVSVAVIFLIIIGIKYMIASPGEKADIKKHLVAYVTGAIVMFGAAGILEMIEKFATGVTT